MDPLPHKHWKKEQLCTEILKAAPVTEKALESQIPRKISPILQVCGSHYMYKDNRQWAS